MGQICIVSFPKQVIFKDESDSKSHLSGPLMTAAHLDTHVCNTSYIINPLSLAALLDTARDYSECSHNDL